MVLVQVLPDYIYSFVSLLYHHHPNRPWVTLTTQVPDPVQPIPPHCEYFGSEPPVGGGVTVGVEVGGVEVGGVVETVVEGGLVPPPPPAPPTMRKSVSA